MFMKLLNASDVRGDFSSFIDKVVRERPMVFKRNRDHVLSISTEIAQSLLESFRFKAIIIPEEDGSTTITLEDFDLVVNAPDHNQALLKMAEELIDYSQDYFDQFALYFKTANRKKHFPYVMKVVLAEGIQEVVGFIDA
jgi:antitoxin YefM